MRSLIAICKLFGFVIWSIPLASVQSILLIFLKDKPIMYNLPHLWHKGVCRIFGLKYVVEGGVSDQNSLLYVSNHLSYLDIFILGAILKSSFVAKREVASWPVIGFLSKLQKTAFIDRSRQAAVREKDSLGAMLKDGRDLILFPEATSTNGADVVSFRSSFFSLAYDPDHTDYLKVHPVTIRLEKVDGNKLIVTESDRDKYAWHGDMTLMPHLWSFLKSRGATLHVCFHDVRHPSDHKDRKHLAESCYQDVKGGLLQQNAA